MSGAANELVDGHAERLALDVPERDVDATERPDAEAARA
jgi:hypothetical protein